MDPNQLALYILLAIVAASVGFLGWVFYHLNVDTHKRHK
jgi:hypothetical protein